MNIKERIIHCLLFEVIAFVFVVLAVITLTEYTVTSMIGLALELSLMTMIWNYIYNLGFDNFFGENRLHRSYKMRIAHGLGFEFGMVFVTYPIMMYVLHLDFWTVLAMDIGIAIFFLVYAIVYNWCYDIARNRIFSVNEY